MNIWPTNSYKCMKEKNYLDSRTTLKVFALNCFRKVEYPEYLFLLFFLFDMNIFCYANKLDGLGSGQCLCKPTPLFFFKMNKLLNFPRER